MLNLLDFPELVAITQDQVHVFVEGFERADEDPAVLQDAPHPEVDVLQHLAALPHRLKNNHRQASLWHYREIHDFGGLADSLTDRLLLLANKHAEEFTSFYVKDVLGLQLRVRMRRVRR